MRGKNEHNMKCWGRKKRTLKYAFSSALNLRDSLWGHNLKRRGPRIRVFMFSNAFSSIPLIHELKYSNIDFPHTASLKKPISWCSPDSNGSCKWRTSLLMLFEGN